MSEKLNLKKELVKKCISIQKERIELERKAMEETQSDANEYGNPEDRYDPFKEQMMKKKGMFAKQLQKAIEELETIEKIDLSKCNEKVIFGSVVITDKQNMIIAVGLGKIEHNGKQYFAISPHVPIYKAIKDLKPGDTYTFNNTKGKIIDVF